MSNKYIYFLLIYVVVLSSSWNKVFGNYAIKLLHKLTGGHHFNYSSNWYSINPQCSGQEQSPIDIETHRAEQQTFPKLSRTRYIEKPRSIKVSKGTHNLVVRPVYENLHPVMTGGPLQQLYKLDHIVFHWGEHNGIGSEHTINGLRYPLEMQAVHYNDYYSSFFDAIGEDGGVAIVSYLFNISSQEEGDLGLDLIQRTFDGLMGNGTAEEKVKYPFPVSILLPPVYKHYVTYEGSLTLPPCSEKVTWIVDYKPRVVTSWQMEKFRMLYDGSPMLINNYRPTQFLNERPLFVVN